MPHTRVPSLGIEEEYQLVDRRTGRLRQVSHRIIEENQESATADPWVATIQHELHLNQIEMASPILPDLTVAKRCIAETRHRLNQMAAPHGAAIVSAGSHPMRLPDADDITPKPRYLLMADRYQLLAEDLYIFGCHIHVDMPDRQLGVAVMNAASAWLPLLQALSANSPYWNGWDTGYASYRREMWMQWPLAGPPPYFANLEHHDRYVQQLVRATAIDEETKIYWDIRLPVKTPTIEFRIFDAMTDIDDVIMCAAIVQALVMKIEADILSGYWPQPMNYDLLKASVWHAARYGIEQDLIDPQAVRSLPAAEHIDAMLNYIERPLKYTGGWDLVQDRIHLRRVEAAEAKWQRLQHRSDRDLVLALIERTAAGTAAGVAAESGDAGSGRP